MTARVEYSRRMSGETRAVTAHMHNQPFAQRVYNAGADAVQTSNLKIMPLEGSTVPWKRDRPAYGNDIQFHVETHVAVEFDCALAGSGTLGTAPGWGKLLVACGCAETIVAAVADIGARLMRATTAEGIETAAAASLGSGLPVVAAYCANALAGFTFPRGIERLVIFADHDHAGQQAAATLAHRATRAGLTPKTLTPSKPGSDWADVWLEGQQ